MRQIRLVLLFMTLVVSACVSRPKESGDTSLLPADLLFHVSDTINEVTDVTSGMIDHVAIVLTTDTVIEAVSRGVVLTPVDSLRRQSGYYIIGKVSGVDIDATLQRARSFLGKPYDELFLPDNDSIYCSELVQLAFVDAQGRPVFEPVPMSFHDSTGHITDYWQSFYAARGMSVPEGWPGTNPVELSRRSVVRLTGDTLWMRR